MRWTSTILGVYFNVLNTLKTVVLNLRHHCESHILQFLRFIRFYQGGLLCSDRISTLYECKEDIDFLFSIHFVCLDDSNLAR